jgi:hypothetical protein
LQKPIKADHGPKLEGPRDGPKGLKQKTLIVKCKRILLSIEIYTTPQLEQLAK